MPTFDQTAPLPGMPASNFGGAGYGQQPAPQIMPQVPQMNGGQIGGNQPRPGFNLMSGQFGSNFGPQHFMQQFIQNHPDFLANHPRFAQFYQNMGQGGFNGGANGAGGGINPNAGGGMNPGYNTGIVPPGMGSPVPHPGQMPINPGFQNPTAPRPMGPQMAPQFDAQRRPTPFVAR